MSIYVTVSWIIVFTYLGLKGIIGGCDWSIMLCDNSRVACHGSKV